MKHKLNASVLWETRWQVVWQCGGVDPQTYTIYMQLLQVKAHFSLDYENRVRGENEVLLYGNFGDPKGGKVRVLL